MEKDNYRKTPAYSEVNSDDNGNKAPVNPCNCNPEILEKMSSDIEYLKDLFTRRLKEDKQKTELIRVLSDGANFSFVEPFINDLILLIDRLLKKADNMEAYSAANEEMDQRIKEEENFIYSVVEELMDMLSRRGVERIKVQRKFDPSLHKAVRMVRSPEVSEVVVYRVVRQGYRYGDRVIRPVEVEVVRPE